MQLYNFSKTGRIFTSILIHFAAFALFKRITILVSPTVFVQSTLYFHTVNNNILYAFIYREF